MRDHVSGFAMPFEIFELNDYIIRSKDGEVEGYSAQIAMVPELKLGVITLSNIVSAGPRINQIVLGIILPAFDATFRSLGTTWPLPPNPGMYIGTYTDQYGSIYVRQQVPGGPLTLEMGQHWGLRWKGNQLPSQPHTFELAYPPGDLNSCMNVQTEDPLEFVFFHPSSDNRTIQSVTMDIYYERLWTKQSSETPKFIATEQQGKRTRRLSK